MSDSEQDPEWGGYLRPVMPRRKERLRLQLSLGLILIDLCAIVAGFVCANILRFGSPRVDIGFPLIELLAAVFVAVAINSGAYSIRALEQRRFGIACVLRAFAVAIGAITVLVFYLRITLDMSRLAFSLGIAVSMLMLIAGRLLCDRVARRAYGTSLYSVVLIQDGIAAPVEPGVVPIDAAASGLRPDIGDPLMLDRLGRLLRHADEVVVACPEERRPAWAMALKGANIQGAIMDPEITRLGAIGTGSYAGSATLLVSAGALSLPNRVLKRLLDLSLAVFGIVAITPVLLATALAIKLDDGGPVLFVQQRLGRGNRLFDMYKFRSMKLAQIDRSGNRSASRDDDRITRVGRIIRKTSIDELPQLLNILIGDMSFVGPRPHALGSLAGDKLFWEVDQRYWHRHASKPGLTGLAQVRGFRGATLERIDLVNRLQADLEYLNGWSLARDIRILLATLKVVVHRNAF